MRVASPAVYGDIWNSVIFAIIEGNLWNSVYALDECEYCKKIIYVRYVKKHGCLCKNW